MSGGNIHERQFTDEEYEKHGELEKAAIERILGPMCEVTGHALIPFELGGNVDMYYFPNATEGTGFVTMELIEPDGRGPKPNRIGTYELLMFSKHKLTKNIDVRDTNHPFNKIERRICSILTSVGRYSYQAVLNPGDTCEVPLEGDSEYACLVLDEYRKKGVHFEVGGCKCGILLCIEIFREEMKYAMEKGSSGLLSKLKEAGYYPYSDLDRKSLI
ncbi:MAG: suppressor of fused domain protein [Sedimentisphaerales bacterium]|nr:suppressor of fused domain protein [Sedimentisphaerales bacterium]